MTPEQELQRTIGEIQGEFRASVKAIRVNLERLESIVDKGVSSLHSRCTKIEVSLAAHKHNGNGAVHNDKTKLWAALAVFLTAAAAAITGIGKGLGWW